MLIFFEQTDLFLTQNMYYYFFNSSNRYSVKDSLLCTCSHDFDLWSRYYLHSSIILSMEDSSEMVYLLPHLRIYFFTHISMEKYLWIFSWFSRDDIINFLNSDVTKK